MNLHELLAFQPQTASLEAGKEPSLEFLICEYYTSYGIDLKGARKLTKKYIDALFKEFPQ